MVEGAGMSEGEVVVKTEAEVPRLKVQSGIRKEIQLALNRRTLRRELDSLGVNKDDPEGLYSVLSTLDLDRLRKMHKLATFGTVGAVNLSMYVTGKNDRVSDIKDPSYAVDLKKGDKFIDLHFEPFAVSTKQDEHAQEAMFLGSVDLIRTIKGYRKRSRVKEMPELIEGTTNPTLAKFAVNRLGFHPYGGETLLNTGEKELVSDPQAIQQMLDETYKVPGVTDYDVSVFMRKEDFLSDAMVDRVTRIRDVMYARLSRNKSRVVTQEGLNQVEKHARAIAIRESIAKGALNPDRPPGFPHVGPINF